MDSSLLYYNKGIQLSVLDVEPTEVTAVISAKIESFRKEINLKSREFAYKARKLNLSREEYDAFFLGFKKKTQEISEKHAILVGMGVTFDTDKNGY
ncbi:hypothetical protein [Kordia sp. SMS9]|uniref:hypothetical protein n=1 Tax=Kordia sp. SMS9 TaxID=2282170 RepID=UPI0013B3C851|nr:hypothetical protein [Kordia sp. SMS9]